MVFGIRKEECTFYSVFELVRIQSRSDIPIPRLRAKNRATSRHVLHVALKSVLGGFVRDKYKPEGNLMSAAGEEVGDVEEAVALHSTYTSHT